MAEKKCPNCNAVNPDGKEIHYCGNCGKPLDTMSYSVVSDNEHQSLKNSYGAFLQSYARLEESEKRLKDDYASLRKRYDRLDSSERSLRRERDRLQARIDRSWTSKLSKWWEDTGVPILIIICIIGVPILLVYLMSRCSSEEISRIEVAGKYGIGTDKDNLVVPAKYDSISAKPTGNQWVLMDKKAGTRGLAYISGDTVNILEPNYTTHYTVWTNGTSVFERPDQTKDIAYKGEVVANVKDVRYTPTFSAGTCMVVTNADGTKDLYSSQGQPVTQGHYNEIYLQPDTMLIVESKIGNKYYYTLYDHYGRRVNDSKYRYVMSYSDGVAWALVDEDDYANDRYSLLDRKGNVLFKTDKIYNPVKYSEGIGWYKKHGAQERTAVDKTGKRVGSTKAYVKGPVTMGLTPVEKDYKLGFVDQNGREVIPPKYKALTKSYAFGRDSTLQVRLDGVKGRLHRNGTFTPDAQ